MPDFQIITVSSHRPTEWYYCYDEFFQSIENHGYTCAILGGSGGYKGLISKPKLLLEHLKGGHVNAKRILFADCWDVLFLRDPAEAVEMAAPDVITFNAEKNLFPFVPGEFPDTGTPYRYLNSGFFIGDTDLVVDLLEKMNLSSIRDDYLTSGGKWHHENDQQYFLEAYVRQLVPMMLDSDVRMCQTMHGITDEEAEVEDDGALHNLICDSRPVAVHGNGGGKSTEMMQRVLRKWREANL